MYHFPVSLPAPEGFPCSQSKPAGARYCAYLISEYTTASITTPCNKFNTHPAPSQMDGNQTVSYMGFGAAFTAQVYAI